MDKIDVEKIATTFRSAAQEMTSALRKITEALSEFLDEADEYLHRWEDEGGAVPDVGAEDDLFCEYCGNPFQVGESKRYSSDMKKVWHTYHWPFKEKNYGRRRGDTYTHVNADGHVCCNECGLPVEPGHDPYTCYAPWEQA